MHSMLTMQFIFNLLWNWNWVKFGGGVKKKNVTASLPRAFWAPFLKWLNFVPVASLMICWRMSSIFSNVRMLLKSFLKHIHKRSVRSRENYRRMKIVRLVIEDLINEKLMWEINRLFIRYNTSVKESLLSDLTFPKRSEQNEMSRLLMTTGFRSLKSRAPRHINC